MAILTALLLRQNQLSGRTTPPPPPAPTAVEGAAAEVADDLPSALPAAGDNEGEGEVTITDAAPSHPIPAGVRIECFAWAPGTVFSPVEILPPNDESFAIYSVSV